jgi:long-chain acyl-CoA synthetase
MRVIGQRVSTGHAAPNGGIPVWPLSRQAGLARTAIQAGLFGLLPVLTPSRVIGREVLDGLEGPFLFAANHVSHFDTPVLLRALPRRLRARTTVAAAKDYFFTRRLRGLSAGLLFNAFPLSRTANLWPPLEQFGFLAERGWSILFFPEGTRSLTGEMQQFRGGIGVLAVELGIPVVPIRTEGLAAVLPRGTRWPRRGQCSVRFGVPLRFERDTSYGDATAAIEAAVRSL